MKSTSLTLLESAKSGSSDAWARLDAIYRPFLLGWFKYRDVPNDVADDLTQQVMLVLSREVTKFEHSGRTGAFRTWLRRTAIYEEKMYWRKRSHGEQAVGGSGLHHALEQLKDDDSDLSRRWDEQHDSFVMQKLLDQISSEFKAKTLTAFRRFAVDGESVGAVAESLEMSTGAIYIAKSRILRRLRQEATGLIDDSDLL